MRYILLGIALSAAACHHGDDTTTGDDVVAGDPLDPSVAPDLDTDPSHYPANIWITDGMVKLPPSAQPGDTHWAILRAARNETESFQVHVRAETGPVRLSIEVSDLVDPVSGTTIPSGAIVVAREAYLDITTLSDANGIGGLVPDALIPAVDPYVHETRNAFPYSIPQGETRSAWIDVFVSDLAASGYYTGIVTVRDDDAIIAALPIQLAVWDVTLPATATLASGFSSEWNAMCVQAYGDYAACGAYPGANGNADKGVELTHVAAATALLDYRMSDAASVYYASGGDWTAFDATYGPLLDGTADTRLPGAKLTHLWFTGDRGDPTFLADWQDHFTAKGWIDRTSVYFCDEPPAGCSFDDARARADVIHGAAPTLQTLLTTDLNEATDEDLLARVDVMVPIVESMEQRGQPSMRGDYDAWLALGGKHLWWYQSCDEHESCSNGNPGPATATWPSYMVDATPVRNRVFQWLAYLYGIEGELYYDTQYCWTQTCGGQDDPWVSQYAFGGNGDGTLYYPGTPAKIGGTTPVPVASIRLSLIRDGMEDYELLHLLDAIDPGAARAAAESFIVNNYTFDNDPSKLTDARRTLGDALHHEVWP